MYELAISYNRPDPSVELFDWRQRVGDYMQINFFAIGKLVELGREEWSDDLLTATYTLVFASEQDAIDYYNDPFLNEVRKDLNAYNEALGITVSYSPDLRAS